MAEFATPVVSEKKVPYLWWIVLAAVIVLIVILVIAFWPSGEDSGLDSPQGGELNPGQSDLGVEEDVAALVIDDSEDLDLGDVL